MVHALVALGVAEDEARAAAEDGRVPLILLDRLFDEEPRYTLAELAERSGVAEEALRAIHDAVGLPRKEKFSETELAEARAVGLLLEVFPLETLVRQTRVRRIAIGRIAMSDLSAIRDDVIAPLRAAGADDLAIAVALAENAERLMPASIELLVSTYRRALADLHGSELVATAARDGGQEVDLAVGFVDVVGYTSVSARIDPTGLDEILSRFETRVFEVAAGHADVAVVKFLGDAAMVVSADAASLAGALLEMVEPAAELVDSPLRAGTSAGPTLIREGDYYGRTVNVAARLTDLARAWTLLADEALRAHLEGRFDLRRVRPLRVRGIGSMRPLAVRAREPAEA